MVEVRGDLTVKVVRGIDLQNLAVFGTCNPYVLVKLKSSLDSLTTGVKDGDNNPSWHETFTFRNAASSDELQICLMEKEGAREGVVSVADFLPSTAWGFPGTGGAERVLEVKMPSSRKPDTPTMGTIVLKMQFHAELKFRPPFGLVKAAAERTGIVTEKAKIDAIADKALDLFFKPIGLAGGVAGRMTKTQKLASGGAAVAVGGGASMVLMALAVPVVFMAVLFLPLTLMGGFFVAALALAIMPFALLVGWLIVCSRPVRCRVWMPSLFWAISKCSLANKVLLQPPPLGTEQ